MKYRITLFSSILVMVLATIWLAFFRSTGLELVLVLLSVCFSAITMLFMYLHDRAQRRRKGG